MSTKWTKAEEAALFDAMGGKHIMLLPKAREIAKRLPGRTPEAIRRHWLLIRWDRKAEVNEKPASAYSPEAGIGNLVAAKSILRAGGLRGRVTIELGE